MTDHLTQRAQHLIEEFEEGQDTRYGIANVLLYLVLAWDNHSNEAGVVGVRCSTLKEMAEELMAPCLLTRALAGDKDAARQFLFEAGFTDEHGQLTGPYKSENLDA